ncbi:MAG: formylglycine-generating enzyme family protein, partial [Planctomycetota bacterium]
PYPWGTTAPGGLANVAIGDVKTPPRPTGTTPGDETIFGIYDMIGNAAEWTSSPYGDSELYRVVRGGAFAPQADAPRAASRFPTQIDTPPHYVGFRLAANVE